ncbi:MAG: hypothetical protein ACR2JH_02705 [Solirubrobacteraceae bacterium]
MSDPPDSVDLDLWLPDPTVRTYHRREAATDPAVLWAAAGSVQIGESGLLGRLIRWRIPGATRDQTYRDMFAADPFVVLDQGERHLLAGLCGTIWTARPALATLTAPSDFREWRAPGTVKVLFAQWAAPTREGAVLVSEVRIAPIDRSARLRLRGLWPLIGRFEGLIGSEPLRLAARRAVERAARPKT